MKTEQALMRDIHETDLQQGELAFWWLGQQSFIVKVGGRVFAFDPYLQPSKARLIPPLLTAQQMAQIDFVLGSHDHGDHIDHSAWRGIAAASPDARFIAPAMFAQALSREFSIERISGLDEGIEYSEDGVTIRAIAAAHEFLDADPVTGWHPSLSYIVECGGLRIYHAGDTCKYEGLESKLIAAGPIDVAFVPINGRDGRKYREGTIGNMDFREAVDLVGAVKPRLAVPAHYDMFAGNSENPMLFADYLEAKYPERAFWIGGHGVRVLLPGAADGSRI